MLQYIVEHLDSQLNPYIVQLITAFNTWGRIDVRHGLLALNCDHGRHRSLAFAYVLCFWLQRLGVQVHLYTPAGDDRHANRLCNCSQSNSVRPFNEQEARFIMYCFNSTVIWHYH